MKIETYLDNQEILQDESEIMEYNTLAEQLGLDQLKIKTGQDHKPAPMNRYEMNVYKACCPTEIELSEYKHVIPKRVLEALSYCKEYLETFKHVEYYVWVDEKPDPVLVAKIDWGKYIMIGRWGNELDSFAELEKRAISITKERLQEIILKMKLIVSVYDKSEDALAKMKLNENIPYIGSI